MTNKEKRRLKKEKRLRQKYDRIKRSEYSEAYLKKKDARGEIPHSYPKTRLVLVRDFITSKDLYKSIGLFLGSQISIFLLLVGADYPDYAPIIGWLSIFIGLICIGFSIREMNKRQSKDVSRKPVDVKLIFKVLAIAFIASTIASMVYGTYGTIESVQPNQEAVKGTLALFPIPMLFTMLFVAPVIEEVIFRELLPYATGPSYLSFFLTSLLFVVVHSPSGLFGWASYGISTVGFLYVRLKNNNIYSGVILHILWNFLSVIL